MSVTTAEVQTLTAEVRVLMVGNRQVTLSVARQLDEFDLEIEAPENFEPFGRVRTGLKTLQMDSEWRDTMITPQWEWIGRHAQSGALVRVALGSMGDVHAEDIPLVRSWIDLPLIVLAGLK